MSRNGIFARNEVDATYLKNRDIAKRVIDPILAIRLEAYPTDNCCAKEFADRYGLRLSTATDLITKSLENPAFWARVAKYPNKAQANSSLDGYLISFRQYMTMLEIGKSAQDEAVRGLKKMKIKKSRSVKRKE